MKLLPRPSEVLTPTTEPLRLGDRALEGLPKASGICSAIADGGLLPTASAASLTMLVVRAEPTVSESRLSRCAARSTASAANTWTDWTP
jgi:hypothetical protein